MPMRAKFVEPMLLLRTEKLPEGRNGAWSLRWTVIARWR